jgi:predicted acylesterase/phospholipase RssA
MFGSYQAGAWLALSKLFTPDLVVGASIGSINGYLIASGCSPETLVDRWLHMHQGDVRWRVPRKWHEGLIDPTNMELLLRNVCEKHVPKIPFGLVTTEFRTMKPKLFRSPDITWEHLGASCAVPVFLKQPIIDGQIHADGGLVDPLPIWGALQMGATRIISVNLLEKRPWIIRAAAHAARLYGGYQDPDLSDIPIVSISPSEVLGGPKDTIYWSRENAERWIELGQKDALESRQLVVECLKRK